MATHITAPNQSPNTLHIQSKEILPHVLPTVAMGDVLRLTVKQNSKGQPGMLYFKGRLIPAKLPEHLNPGDQILAQISKDANQLALKILDVQRPGQAAPTTATTPSTSATRPTTTSNIAHQLESMVRASGSPAFDSVGTANTSIRIGDFNLDPATLKNLANTLGSADILSDPTSTHSQLLASTDGSLSDSLKALVNSLKDILARSAQNQNNAVKGENAGQAPLDPKTSAELQRIATHLEQMAATQETLNQLNPLMQALGEPALILFPFLFQGLLAHSKVTVEQRNSGKQHGGKKRKDGKKEGGCDENSETLSYHRIQVSVPLPYMGNVDVDIAHKDKEILVRFTVEDSDVSSFLVEQLEHLGATLREHGFENAELVSNVGMKQENSSSWAFGLHSSRSLIA